MPSPARLSYQLRREDSPHLNCRRWLVGLSFVGSAAGMIVGLYQMGVLRRLPDLPVGPFDATRVDASTYAYKRLQTPDGLLLAATYAVTAILAGAGGWDRARENPAPAARARRQDPLRRSGHPQAGAGGMGGEQGAVRLLPDRDARLAGLGRAAGGGRGAPASSRRS